MSITILNANCIQSFTLTVNEIIKLLLNFSHQFLHHYPNKYSMYSSTFIRSKQNVKQLVNE